MKSLTLTLAMLFLAACATEMTALQCLECPEIEVIRVIDGDTFETPNGEVRLFGVDTPELGQRCSGTAKRRLEELLGETARYQLGPRTVDPYGKLLYYMYTEPGQSIDELLISEGLGRAWFKDGQHKDHLVGLEKEARANGVGCLW